MFTGLIEEVGKILKKESLGKSQRLTIGVKNITKDLKIGDSVAINGVCTTVVQFDKEYFVVDLSFQTVQVTTFDCIKEGCFVNLERALKIGERLGGHLVYGHVDFKGKYINNQKIDESFYMTFEIPKEQAKYFVNKGSVTVDGVSLTIANKYDNNITLCLIPHTLENTALKYLKIGSNVNIEIDVVSKYIENFIVSNDNRSKITDNFLKENGFL